MIRMVLVPPSACHKRQLNQQQFLEKWRRAKYRRLEQMGSSLLGPKFKLILIIHGFPYKKKRLTGSFYRLYLRRMSTVGWGNWTGCVAGSLQSLLIYWMRGVSIIPRLATIQLTKPSRTWSVGREYFYILFMRQWELGSLKIQVWKFVWFLNKSCVVLWQDRHMKLSFTCFRLCPGLKSIFEHGLKRSHLLGGSCHPWLFIEEVNSTDYISISSPSGFRCTRLQFNFRIGKLQKPMLRFTI